MILKEWRPYLSGGLRGYVKIELDVGLVIPNIRILVGSKRPVHLDAGAAGARQRPAEEGYERQACLRADRLLEGPENDRKFSAAVIERLLAKYPNALDGFDEALEN